MMTNKQQLMELRERTCLSLKDCDKALKQAGNIEDAILLLKQWGELKGKEKAHKIPTEGIIKIISNIKHNIVSIFEINTETDFLSRSKEFNELVSLLNDFDKFELRRKELVAQTGENIVLRRKEQWTPSRHSAIRWYVHPGDKLAVLIEVACESALTESAVDFADECAMQIAAMAPTVVSKDDIPADVLVRQRRIFEAQLEEEKKPAASWQKIIEGKFIKWRKDIVLLEQESIKDSKKTIEQMRQEAGKDVQILRFARYSLGEGLEKKQEDLAVEVEKLMTKTQIVPPHPLNR